MEKTNKKQTNKRTTDTERNEKTFFKYDLIQIREQHGDREAWARVQEQGEESPLISSPLARSPHLITQSMGQVKGSWIPWHIWMPELPTERVLAVGRGREQLVGWPHGKVTGLGGGRRPAGWLLPAVFVGVSAPPQEAGILISRTTSDAEGIEEQVFSGTKPCKWINRCWLLPGRGVLCVDIVFCLLLSSISG